MYRLYTERLQRAGAMVFDDLIGNTVAVLSLFDGVSRPTTTGCSRTF